MLGREIDHVVAIISLCGTSNTLDLAKTAHLAEKQRYKKQKKAEWFYLFIYFLLQILMKP